MTETITATCWAQITPRWSYWNRLIGARVDKVTFRKPSSPAPGCLLVRLNITVPANAFVPPELLEGSVQLAPGDFEVVPVRVEPS